MKTSLKKSIALIFTAVILASSSMAATAGENTKKVTTLSNVKNITKVVVSGNVKVMLVQDKNESVKVYDNYYSKNALVQQHGSELRISSFAPEVLTVVVYVNNLNSIEASDNATVSTFGKFNLLSLQVTLKDNAVADINSNTICLYSSVEGSAQLKLNGSADVQSSIANNSATTVDYTKRQMLKDMVITGEIAANTIKK